MKKKLIAFLSSIGFYPSENKSELTWSEPNEPLVIAYRNPVQAQITEDWRKS